MGLFSANATARFSVVVVFATPPFWLAKAMTLASALAVTGGSDACVGEPIAPVIRNRRWFFLPAAVLLFALGDPGGLPRLGLVHDAASSRTATTASRERPYVEVGPSRWGHRWPAPGPAARA